jgi:hypothetical protein
MPTYRLTLPAWHPTPVNRLVGAHFGTRARRKRHDRELVAAHALAAGIPRATRRRRVQLCITLGPRQRAADPDAYWKSTLDALVACGQLVNDSRQWVELGPVTFARGPAPATSIVLEDLGEGGAGART